MTETTAHPGPAAPPTPEVVRPTDGRVWLGVCAAVGRATGTDPVLWRVAVAVLTVFGGAGVPLYAAGWLLLRDEAESESVADRLLRHRRRHLSPSTLVVVALVVVGAFTLLSLVLGVGWGRPRLVPVAVVGLVAYLVLRRPTAYAPVGAVGTTPVGASPAGAAPPGAPTEQLTRPLAAGDVPPAPPPRPKGPPVTLLTISAALVVAGALLIADALGTGGITAPRVAAAVLAVLGIGLVAGARHGWHLGLIALTLLTAGLLTLTACVNIPFDASVGERAWSPVAGTSYALGAGEATLDLAALPQGADVDLRTELGAGRLVVLLPDTVRLELHAEVAAGSISLPERGITGGHRLAADGGDLELDRVLLPSAGSAAGPVVHLDVQLGLGELEVRRG